MKSTHTITPPEQTAVDTAGPAKLSLTPARLSKHADYQRVYKEGRKQFSQQMSFFYALRAVDAAACSGPRVGLTVPKALGKAVDRNRIKRRMREAVRQHLGLLNGPVDVVLHPRKTVREMEFAKLEREVVRVFQQIAQQVAKMRPDLQQQGGGQG